MPNETGDTVGVWLGPEHSSLLADFDAIPGTRSANIRRAMALLVGVESAFEAMDVSIEQFDERELRHLVRQGVLDVLRE